MRFLKIKFILLLSVISTIAFAQREKIDGIVAVVGDKIIMLSDMEQMAYQMKSAGLKSVDKCSSLEELLSSKLLLNSAISDSIAVSDSEINSMAEQRLKGLVQRIGSIEDLLKLHNKSKIELKQDIKDILKEQLLAQRMQQKVIKDIEVSPKEVKDFFDKIPKEELPEIDGKMKYAQIFVIPKISESAKQEVVNKLKAIKKEIESGDDFATKAMLNSEDPGSSSNGGEYKGVKKGVFVKEFEEVMFSLSENEISEPFETEFGYHIVQVLKKNDDNSVDLRHILLKLIPSDKEISKSKELLEKVKSDIENNKITFAQAVQMYSEDKISKSNDGVVSNPKTGDLYIKTSDMDTDIYLDLSIAEKDEITDVKKVEVGRKIGFAIHRLVDKTESHKLSVKDDYKDLQNLAKNNKMKTVVSSWQTDKIKRTFVKIDDSMLGCNFRQNWTKK